MEKIKNLLSGIGLSQKEAEIYTILVTNGASSVLDISKRTSIHRPNIYDTLRSLVAKGFVYEIEGPTKRFSARELESIRNYLNQKMVEFEVLMKEYGGRTKRDSNKIKVSKGLFAFREAIYTLFNTGKPISIYGTPKEASDIIGPVLKEFHKERIKRKIPLKHIYNSDGIERVKYLNKLKYTEGKVLPEKFNSVATIAISGNKVLILFWEKELICVEIEDANMALPYEHYFDILWAKAKTPQ